jgi:hypothetical protein
MIAESAMYCWLLLFVVALGGVLLGAISLLLSDQRRPRAHEGAVRRGSRAPSWRQLNRGVLCLLPLVVYLLFGAFVARSLLWSGILVGFLLSAIVALMALYVSRAGGGGDRRTDAS